ncbi:MAG TPA: PEGA domain-containing protein [Anaeromyxobacter sp.]|nr:PEGA domain-containing protein [Anaeromyxobacter sp.]
MKDPIRSSTSRIAGRALALLLPLCALALGTPWLLGELRVRAAPGAARLDRGPTEEEVRQSRRADGRLAELEKRALGEASTIAPVEAERDGSGERVRRFAGFGLSVESVPGGARVLVNGEEMGTTPLTTSVRCLAGEEVRVEVRKDGYGPARRVTRCRVDQLVEMAVGLK